MPDLDQHALAKLAFEMAMNIRPPEAIFADYCIDESEYYEITKLPFYQRAKEQYTIEWNSTTSTKDRVGLSSAYLLEQVLPVISARAMSPTEPLASVNDTAKLLAKNAGIGEVKQQNGNAAERFIITINLGADVDGKPVIEHYDKPVAANTPVMAITPAIRNPEPESESEPESEPEPDFTPAEQQAIAALMER